MANTQLRIRRPRTTHLSDPFCDFTSEMLREILNTPDGNLRCNDYRNLLGPFLPAGAYEESVYFLPLAMDYLCSHEDEALDLITSIVWFASEYAKQLDSEGMLHATRERLREILRHLTCQFTVIHFDRKACAQKGWGNPSFNLVHNAEVVCVGTSDLVRFKTHQDLAEEFTLSLAHHDGDPIKAAWFLEYARCQSDVYTPPEIPSITSLLSDRLLLEQAASVVIEKVMPNESSPNYWDDTFAFLGL